MNFYPTIWQVLHDGCIIAIEGEVPGTVRLDVSIEYLRARFADPGETIQVTLTGCTRFAYRDFDADEFITDLSTIAASSPEILSAKTEGQRSEVVCVRGLLEVTAAGEWLALDSGRGITLQELLDVAQAYWQDWSRHR